MSVTTEIFPSRKMWLEARGRTIGGSDAASVLGISPWMTNVELWEVKTGRREQKDISDTPVAAYGTKAEEFLRGLFGLDFPEYDLRYKANNLWRNTEYPFAHTSLDGWMYDKTGRLGILEIKTAEMLGQSSWLKWENGVPQGYYSQVVHSMAITEAEFAVLKAQLKYWKRQEDGAEVMQCTVRHYFFERNDVCEDIAYLMDREADFCKHIEGGTRPDLILPPI